MIRTIRDLDHNKSSVLNNKLNKDNKNNFIML